MPISDESFKKPSIYEQASASHAFDQTDQFMSTGSFMKNGALAVPQGDQHMVSEAGDWNKYKDGDPS